MGIFSAFLDDEDVKLYGVEPGGMGLETGAHAASLTMGRPGILHGFRTILIQDDKGEPLPVSAWTTREAVHSTASCTTSDASSTPRSRTGRR